MAFGAEGYVAYAPETTEGTLVAPTIMIPVTSFGFDDSDDTVKPAEVRLSRDYSVSLPQAFNVSGSMDALLYPKGFMQLIKAVAAADTADVTTTADTPVTGVYTHVITPGKKKTTFTFEENLDGIMVKRYGGIAINTLEIKAAFNEIVAATWGLEGSVRQKQVGPTAGLDESDYADVDPFHFTGASINIDAVDSTIVKDFTFGINNNTDRIGALRKSRAWSRIPLGMREVTLEATADFIDDVEFDRFDAGTYFPVDLKFEGPTIPSKATPYSVAIALPKVKWSKAGAPLDAGSFIEQAITAEILRPSGGDIFTITVVTDAATL